MRNPIAIGLALLVTACAAQTPASPEPEELSQLQPGKTTYAEAVAALGTPVGTTIDFDNTRGATFVYRIPPAPPAAPPAGSVPADTLANVRPAAGGPTGMTVIVRCSFDGNEILLSCRSQQVPQPVR